MKKKLIAMLLVVALAVISVVPALATSIPSKIDLQFAFEQVDQPLQLASISNVEMDETRGAFSLFGFVILVKALQYIVGDNTLTKKISDELERGGHTRRSLYSRRMFCPHQNG